MGNHNLNIKCKNIELRQKIERQLTYYTSYDSELRDRVNVSYRPKKGQITVSIIGYERFLNTKEEADAVKEVAETILFECGNALNAQKQLNTRTMFREPGKTVADVGRRKSDIEALQSYDLWEILGKSGLSLSKYGERQAREILSFGGSRSKYLTRFATSGHASEFFVTKVSDAGWDSAGMGTITIDLSESTGGSVTSLNSENMYTFTSVKNLTGTQRNDALTKFVPGDSSWGKYIDAVTNNVDVSNKQNILFYCVMLDLATKGWRKANSRAKLKIEIINYAIASNLSVDQILTEKITNVMKEKLAKVEYTNQSTPLSILEAICDKQLVNYRI